MLVQKLNACAEFIAGDDTRLRELLHPDKQPLELRYSLAHATLPVGQTSRAKNTLNLSGLGFGIDFILLDNI